MILWDDVGENGKEQRKKKYSLKLSWEQNFFFTLDIQGFCSVDFWKSRAVMLDLCSLLQILVSLFLSLFTYLSL